MSTLIKQVYLTLNEYGPKRGTLSGTVTFRNEHGEIQVNIDPTKAACLVQALAVELVKTAEETATLMVSDVLEQADMKALEVVSA